MLPLSFFNYPLVSVWVVYSRTRFSFASIPTPVWPSWPLNLVTCHPLCLPFLGSLTTAAEIYSTQVWTISGLDSCFDLHKHNETCHKWITKRKLHTSDYRLHIMLPIRCYMLHFASHITWITHHLTYDIGTCEYLILTFEYHMLQVMCFIRRHMTRLLVYHISSKFMC